jgi:DNA-binding beta-propeller fold protein YncE/HEAT repeat protein
MMSMILRRVALLWAVAMLAAAGCSSDPELVDPTSGPAWQADEKPAFARAPTATLDGSQVKISFAVTKATDLAVCVKDDDGKTVRHIVAGMLGPKAPEPLQANSLEQSLIWDGLDDIGRPVPEGKYRIEVNLGLSASYDRTLRLNHRRLGTVHGLAVGLGRELYVMSAVGRDSFDGVFRILTKDGEYVKTIMPRRSDLPLARTKPLGEFTLDSGERVVPVLLDQYLGRIYQVPVVLPLGDLIFTNRSTAGGHPEARRFGGVYFKQTLPRRLLRLAPDGTASHAGYLGPILPKCEKGILFLDYGPAGDIYVSGARHVVFRTKWGAGEKPVPFVGTLDKPGKGATGLNNPQGIAFDVRGNLYVADRGNHRIAVFDQTAKLVAELPLEWPRQVMVNAFNGIVYATAGFKTQTLYKFDGRSAKAPSAKLDLGTTWPFVAMPDTRTEMSVAAVPLRLPAILYAANVNLGGKKGVLVRIKDTGSALVLDKVLSEPGAPEQPLLYGVDRKREWVYGTTNNFGQYFRMNGLTGETEYFKTQMAPKANGVTEFSIAPDGTVGVHVTREIGRLGPRLRPMPFSATGSYVIRTPGEDCLKSFYGRGCTVAPNGDVYWLHERGGYGQPMRCSAMNVDGTLKKDSLIVFEDRSVGAIRVDRQGNVYVLDHLKPLGKPTPDVFRGKVPTDPRDKFTAHYGSIIKFKPTGGAVREADKGIAKPLDLKPGQMQFTVAGNKGNYVTDGALWSYYGVSQIRSWRNFQGCKCWTPRFDLDDFARVFVPDQLRNRIVVLDTNGNELLTFGRYGNVDELGKSLVFADPRTVMVSRDAAYVGDMNNQCVVRVKLSYNVTAAVPVLMPERTLADLTNDYSEKGMIPERRRSLWLLNATLRVGQARQEALKLSPSLDGGWFRDGLDWDAMVPRVMNQSVAALANYDDACAVLALTAASELPDWPEKEVRALLGKYLAEGNELLRMAVCWALWDKVGGEAGPELLKQALADESQRVRVVAAYVLAAQGDAAGLAELFTGAMSTERVVYNTAETAILKYVMKWDASDPRARLVDGHAALVPSFPLGEKEVAALAKLLKHTRPPTDPKLSKKGMPYWYLRRATLFLLSLSEQPGAAVALLQELRDVKLKGNNLNRVVGGLGTLRCREAVPDLIGLLSRGSMPTWRGGHSDRAEMLAAVSLARIGDPKSVGRLIFLLTDDKADVRGLAHRTLSQMFDPAIPADRRLVPRGSKLVGVRVDEVPGPGSLRAAWEGFWKVSSDRYGWNAKAPGLLDKRAVVSADSSP